MTTQLRAAVCNAQVTDYKLQGSRIAISIGYIVKRHVERTLPVALELLRCSAELAGEAFAASALPGTPP